MDNTLNLLQSYEEILKRSKEQHIESMDEADKKFEWIGKPLKIKDFLNYLKGNTRNNHIGILGYLKYLFTFYKYNGFAEFAIKHNAKIQRMRSIIKFLEIRDLEKKFGLLKNTYRRIYKQDSADLYRDEEHEEFNRKLSENLKRLNCIYTNHQ